MANFYQITRTEFTVAQYIGWMRSGELELNPHFQRRSVWKAPAKSYFIDTVSRGLPIPIIFLRERTDLNTLKTIREVVDGQQRLRTLFSFIAAEIMPDYDRDRDGFVVKRLHNEEIGDKVFSELSKDIRQQLISYQISTHVLPSSTSDAEVLDMFRRMNASGVKLNNQELRNAKYFGAFSQYSKDLARDYLDAWRGWRLFTDSDFARMREVEFTSELLILCERGIQEKTQNAIDGFYKKNDETYAAADLASKSFKRIMRAIAESIGPQLKTTPFSNTAMFYCLFASLLDLKYGAASNTKIRSAKAQSIMDGLAEKLVKAGKELAQRDKLPQRVAEAIISRSNRFSNRSTLKEFIDKRLTGNGSN